MLLCNRCYLAQRPLNAAGKEGVKNAAHLLIFVHWEHWTELHYHLCTLFSRIFFLRLVSSSHQTEDQDFWFRGSMPCFCHLGELTKAALPIPMSASTYKMAVTMLISSVKSSGICSSNVQNKDEILLLLFTICLQQQLGKSYLQYSHNQKLHLFF